MLTLKLRRLPREEIAQVQSTHLQYSGQSSACEWTDKGLASECSHSEMSDARATKLHRRVTLGCLFRPFSPLLASSHLPQICWRILPTMSADDVVQRLDHPHDGQGGDDAFIGDDDVLEMEETFDDGMDADSDEGEAEEAGEEPDEGHGDDMEDMLANGLDDSVVTFGGHGQGNAVFCVALHPLDPLIAVSGGEDDKGRIWRTDTGAEVAVLSGHEDSVTSVGWSFDGEMVATGGMDGRVRVWRKAKGTQGYLTWEFLTTLEGMDEVLVRLLIPMSSKLDLYNW